MRIIGEFVLVLTVVAVFAMAAPFVTGDGAGVIRVGNAELRLAFHVAKSVDLDSAQGKTVQLQVDLRLPYFIASSSFKFRTSYLAAQGESWVSLVLPSPQQCRIRHSASSSNHLCLPFRRIRCPFPMGRF